MRRKVSMFFFNFFQGADRQGSYMSFRIALFLSMVAISLVPGYVINGLTYGEYKKLLKSDERDQLLWSAQGGKKSLEVCVEECKSVVRFISMDYTFEELLDQDVASELFARIRAEYEGIVDLGVIDSDGIQRTYAGPYRLRGYDYSEQDWYHKILARRMYVSNVFMGYRKVPHFVIAVTNKLPDKEEYWVLRVTIDVKKLEDAISGIAVKEVRDIFLVDEDGVLQTASTLHGKVLGQYPNFSLPGSKKDGVITVLEESKGGHEMLQATIAVEDTPWFLVLVKEGYVHGKEWETFLRRLRILFVISFVVVLVVVYQLVNSLTDRLMDAEQKRQAILTEVEHSSKLASVGRLAAGVAHEINNPLAVINQKAGLMSDLLEMSDDFGQKEKFQKSIDGIQGGVERCKKITHRLLGFARRMDVSLEQIDINDLLREVLGFLEKEALYSRIDIDLSLDEALPAIVSDRGQLQQIFLNIMNNGIDAIGHDGAMLLETRQSGPEMIEVLIKDNGPGMTPDVMRHVFDPFFTTKNAGEGTGLGLSITYGLVKKLGGTIEIDSEVDVGTVFTVSLPLEQTHEAGEENG